jgi:hypothetical protein
MFFADDQADGVYWIAPRPAARQLIQEGVDARFPFAGPHLPVRLAARSLARL